MPSPGAFLVSLFFSQATGVQAGIQNGWWHTTHYAERVFQARAYHHTLNETAGMLPDVKSRGYSVVNLDWPVMSGPVNLYGGFGPKDYYHVEPLIGTDDDWLNFVEVAHALDLKVVSWFNPSYFWTGATAFKTAEAHIVEYGVNGDSLPPDSPARWFRWTEKCNHAHMKPRDEDADSFYNGEGHWVKDPDAGGACYWSVFSDQPSGDLSVPEWQEEVKRIFKHWVGTGIDGFMLDAPYDYIGVGPPKSDLDATLIREIIIDTVHSLRDGQVAVFGEEYSAREPDLARSLDGSIVGNWVVEGGLRSLDVATLIRAGSSVELESMLEAVDALHEMGSVARTRPDFCQWYEDFDDEEGLTANVLQAATIAMLGGYYEVMSTCQDDVGAGIGDFGDYELWAGEVPMAPVLLAVRKMPALRPGTPRSLLEVNSSGAYAALRGCKPGSCGQEQAALVVLNFQNSPQTLKVRFAQFALQAQVSGDLLTDGDGPSIIQENGQSDLHMLVTLPPLGFGLYSVQLPGEPVMALV